MRPLVILLWFSTLFAYCGTANRSNSTSVSGSNRFKRAGGANAADSIIITGSQYVPVEGRAEGGVRSEIAGKWILVSLNGYSIPVKSNLNISPTKTFTEGGKPYTGKVVDEAMRNSKEIKRDSTVTTKGNNTITETTVYLVNNDAKGNKITPPQGLNYHIPEKPSLNFYGSNETFTGFTGCNKISGRYTINGTKKISFQNAAASTKMVCIGDYDEEAFLNALRSINSFKAYDGQLKMMNGDKVVLVFSKQ